MEGSFSQRGCCHQLKEAGIGEESLLLQHRHYLHCLPLYSRRHLSLSRSHIAAIQMSFTTTTGLIGLRSTVTISLQGSCGGRRRKRRRNSNGRKRQRRKRTCKGKREKEKSGKTTTWNIHPIRSPTERQIARQLSGDWIRKKAKSKSKRKELLEMVVKVQ